jgi:hypothetical protein
MELVYFYIAISVIALAGIIWALSLLLRNGNKNDTKLHLAK